MAQEYSHAQGKTPGLPINLLIGTAVITLILTVVALELMGKIKHTETGDAFQVAEYKGILLQAGESHRLSTKAPVIEAHCQEGLIIFQSSTQTEMRALIVDYKNRPILCQPTFETAQ